MCGIAGFVDLSGRLPLEEKLNHILEAMEFRGPDGGGTHVGRNFVVGMRRLSIIDHLGGEQPQSNENGQIMSYRMERYIIIELFAKNSYQKGILLNLSRILRY